MNWAVLVVLLWNCILVNQVLASMYHIFYRNQMLIKNIFLESQSCSLSTNAGNGFCIRYSSCQDFKGNVNVGNIKFILQNYKACQKKTAPILHCCTHDTDIKNHENYKLFNNTVCGLKSNNRIAKGNKTKIRQYPWHALLEFQSRDGKRTFSCGGSLISDRYVSWYIFLI